MGACCSGRSGGVLDDSLQASSLSMSGIGRRKTSFPNLLGGMAGGNPNMAMASKPMKANGIARAQFILDNPGKIQKFYNLQRKKLGEGGYGYVSQASHKASGIQRAVKKVPKRKVENPERLLAEMSIMKHLDHPNIIKLHETFEDKTYVYMVMELCQGGELFDRIIEAGSFTEVQVAIIMQQILRAVFYMHQNGIVHRDIKPENFLFLTSDPIDNNTLKIIDFGLAKHWDPSTPMTTKAGTPYYVAPEVLGGCYDTLCDVWSCGVIMYILLCGFPPFSGSTDQEVLRAVQHGRWSFRGKAWKCISEEAKDLIGKLLEVVPKERYAAGDALSHCWTKLKVPKVANLTLQDGFVQKLRHFQSEHKLKRAALSIIAGQLSEEKIKELRATFEAFDSNHDGQLSVGELKEGLANSGLLRSNTDLEQIMENVDSDGSGHIDYTEFLAATIDRRCYLTEDVCWAAFSVFDINGDGKISHEELRRVLGSGDMGELMTDEDTAALLREVDTNGDGKIDFDEFMMTMRRVNSRRPGED